MDAAITAAAFGGSELRGKEHHVALPDLPVRSNRHRRQPTTTGFLHRLRSPLGPGG